MAVFNEVYKQVVAGGLPKGGAPGQILSKKTAENYDAEWVDAPEGGPTGITQSEADARYLKLTGGNLTGSVSVNNKTLATEEKVQQLIDASASSGGGGVGKSTTGKYMPAGSFTAVGKAGAEIFNDYSEPISMNDSSFLGELRLESGNAAIGIYSHAENNGNMAYSPYSHSEGNGNVCMSEAAHAEGYRNTANQKYSHAEGAESICNSPCGHTEGYQNFALHGKAYYYYSISATSFPATTVTYHAMAHMPSFDVPEARDCVYLIYNAAVVAEAVIESVNTTTSQITFSEPIPQAAQILHSDDVALIPHVSAGSTHTEGTYNIAVGQAAHAEGIQGKAFGRAAHSEGQYSVAVGEASHVQGAYNMAIGNNATAGGYGCYAEAEYSLAYGNSCTAKAPGQVALGKGNRASTLESDRVIVGKGSNSNCFRITDTGTYASGNYNASGADYAELFQWADGNPNNEDRVGLFVTLDGEKIKLADVNSDLILGVVSGSPSVVGDVYDDQWQGMYLVDIYGRPIMETVEIPAETIEVPDPKDTEKTITQVIRPARTETIQKLNPEYDPTQKYVPRTQRPEWDAVGMLGKLVVLDDGTSKVNGYCYPGKMGIATASKEPTPYRVMSRLDETHIRVLILG